MTDATPFARAIETLRPGATGRDLVELLDGSTERTVALHWRSGRRAAPRWALQLLANKLRQQAAEPLKVAAELEALPERLGKKAGAVNLARYLARRS